VRLTRWFLSGKNQLVIDDLVALMDKASQNLEFEQAAQLRDQIAALRKVQEQQTVSGDQDEMDVIGFHYSHGVAAVHVLFVRDRKILGSKTYHPKIPADTDPDEVLPAFLLQFYLNGISGQSIPRDIVLGHELADAEAIADAIGRLAERKVNLLAVKRGEKARYLSLAEKNAKTACDSKLSVSLQMAVRYSQLKKLLKLEVIQRMECFDISHTMGQQTIASCVVFNGEGPDKGEYRRFNVEGITPGDDYAAMQFAMNKRYGKLQDESRVPDIVIIDGGLGQLNQAISFFETFSLQKKPLLLGVAKGTSRKPGLETLVLPNGKEMSLPPDAPALHLIQQIRDEAHRYAITGHRNKRGKKLLQSPLENIAGIGEKRRQALLQYLGGLQGVMKATVQELATVPGISKAQAEVIYSACHNKN
jgi:excinuclease ABC subunit C